MGTKVAFVEHWYFWPMMLSRPAGVPPESRGAASGPMNDPMLILRYHHRYRRSRVLGEASLPCSSLSCSAAKTETQGLMNPHPMAMMVTEAQKAG